MKAAAGDSLSGQLAAYWSRARFEDLPAEVVHAAKRFLLDTLAAGTAGGATAGRSHREAVGCAELGLQQVADVAACELPPGLRIAMHHQGLHRGTAALDLADDDQHRVDH